MDLFTGGRDLLVPLALLAVWFVLMRFVLPRFGITT
jgi:hypothetical protein